MLASFKIATGVYVGKEGQDFAEGDAESRLGIQEHEAGIRVVLGERENAPDLYIERQVDKWVVVIHPENGGDAIGAVEFQDDGRVFYQRECCINGDLRIEMTRDFPGPQLISRKA